MRTDDDDNDLRMIDVSLCNESLIDLSLPTQEPQIQRSKAPSYFDVVLGGDDEPRRDNQEICFGMVKSMLSV